MYFGCILIDNSNIWGFKEAKPLTIATSGVLKGLTPFFYHSQKYKSIK
jgi:hypothetical protein